MIQHNQVGKYRKKDSVLDAKVGKTFILPSGKEYQFKSYRKEGRRYIFTITYKGNNCQFPESDFNKINLCDFFTQMDKDLLIN